MSKFWTISDETWEVRYALKETYDDMVDNKNLFPNKYSLFCAGLVYGLLHNKQHDVPPTAYFIKLGDITDKMSKDIVDLVFRVLDDGTDKIKIWQKMLSIADGGVLELSRIYEHNKNFKIPHLLQDAKKLWPERMVNLHNINLKDSVD